MPEGISNNFESYKYNNSQLQAYDGDGDGELSLFEIQNINNEQGLEILLEDMEPESEEEQVSSLEAQLKSVSDEQGFLSSAWNGLKCLTGIGSSTNKCEKAIEDFKNGKISYDEASAVISEFQNKQKSSVNLVANIATGVAAVAVVGSAVLTGGLSLGVVAAAAGVGAATKAGLKFADRATNKVEGDALDGKQITKDALSGAVDGAISVATMGLGTTAVTGKTVATQTVKQTIIQGAKRGALDGAISGAVTGASDYTIEAALEDDVQFNFGDLTKSTFANAAGGALAGGVLGGASSGIQYKKVAALKTNSSTLHSTYNSHIDEATQQIKDTLGDSATVKEVTGRAKSEESIFEKLFSKLNKGKLKSTDIDDCIGAIGDGYGTRIQLNSLSKTEAEEIIKKGLDGTGISVDDFIKYMDGQIKSFDGVSDETLQVISSDIINSLKEKQTGEIVQNIIDGIKSGKLSITELNNYGDEVTSYFTNSQLQSIADAYFEKTGKQLDIVTLEDFNNASGTKVTVDGEEVYTSNIKTKGAQKDTGYPSTHFNLEHTFEDGTKGVGETQVRGGLLNKFADKEHVPYDIWKGKIKADDPKYANIYSVLDSMAPESRESYKAHIKEIYRWYRLNELGIETTEPVLDGMFKNKAGEVISSDLLKLISRQGLMGS